MDIADEQSGLRRLLAALESGSMMISENGVDVTGREMSKLKADIAALERRQRRLRRRHSPG
jgi:hypothetical protein